MPTLGDAREIAGVIAQKSHPVSVIVFGSVAKYGEGNDIDLLLVYETGESSSVHAVRREVHRDLKPFYKRFAIDPLVVSLSSLKRVFRNGSPFLRLIQREGRVLYMRDSIRQWKKHSGEDLESARYLLKGKFFRGACYYAQQAIEKSLKALLYPSQIGFRLLELDFT